MSDVTIDLSNYKDRVGSRVAPGRYRVTVESVDIEQSSAGNDMIVTTLRIIGDETFDGANLIDRLVLTPKSLFRVVGFMNAIGLPTPKKRLRVNTQRFIGQQLEIEVEDGEPYNGRVKSEVRAYYRIPKSAAPSDDLDDLEEIDVDDDPVETLAERVEAARPQRPSVEDGAVDLDDIDI